MHTRTRRTLSRPAFTLVELLVVIGIIALLISILLPTLSRARESANTVACASNLRQVGQSANMFQNEHLNWLNPAGPIRDPFGDVSKGLITGTFESFPRNVRDSNEKKYAYMTDSVGNTKLASMPVALAPYLGVTMPVGTYAEIATTSQADGGLSDIWRCAGVDQNYQERPTISDNYAYHPNQRYMDYISNASMLGGTFGFQRMGKMSSVDAPTEIVLLMDGLTIDGKLPPPGAWQWNMVESFPDSYWPRVTVKMMWDERHGWNGARWSRQLDTSRHGNRANALFLDGHVTAHQLGRSGPDDTQGSEGLAELVLGTVENNPQP